LFAALIIPRSLGLTAIYDHVFRKIFIGLIGAKKIDLNQSGGRW
jgi:hypothetical protein